MSSNGMGGSGGSNYGGVSPPSAFNTAYGMKSQPTANTGGSLETGGFTPSGVMSNSGFNSNPLQGSSGYSLGGGFPGWGSSFDYAPGVTTPMPHQFFEGTQPGGSTPPPTNTPPPPPFNFANPSNPGTPPYINPPPVGDPTRPPVFPPGDPRGNPPPPTDGRVITPPGTSSPPIGNTPPPPPGNVTRPILPGNPKLAGGPAAGSNDALMQAVLTGQGGGAFDPSQLNQYGPPQGGGSNWADTLKYYQNNQARLNRQGPMYQPGGMFYDPSIDGQ